MGGISIPSTMKIVDSEFYEDKQRYDSRVEKLNDLFELKDSSSKFIKDHPPTFFSGDLRKKLSFILIGINPGYSNAYNEKERKLRSETRKEGGQFSDCFEIFSIFRKHKLPRYYSNYLKILPGSNELTNGDRKIDFCEEHLVNVDAFPFHSSNFIIDVNSLTPEQIKFLFHYWNIAKDLIEQIDADYILIMGSHNYRLLLLDKEVGYENLEEIEKIPKHKNNNSYIHLYRFNLRGKKGLAIDNFIGGSNRTLTREDILNIRKVIQREIKGK